MADIVKQVCRTQCSKTSSWITTSKIILATSNRTLWVVLWVDLWANRCSSSSSNNSSSIKVLQTKIRCNITRIKTPKCSNSSHISKTWWVVDHRYNSNSNSSRSSSRSHQHLKSTSRNKWRFRTKSKRLTKKFSSTRLEFRIWSPRNRNWSRSCRFEWRRELENIVQTGLSAQKQKMRAII